jgi:outer membrane protein OmpA-like peptidoglycan-associated protein
MNKRSVAWIAVIALLATLGSTGCVTKKLFRKNVEETDQRVSGVESGVEANERRIEELSAETDSRIAAAQGTAEKAVEIGNKASSDAVKAQAMAEKAARGKLLWEVTLSDESVKFAFDQTELPDAAKAPLDNLISKVKGYGKAVYVEIEGHTDNIGSADYNMTLGERRAEAVKRYMNQSGGIPLHAINVISYGEANPVADNGTPDGRSANRRVVIKVLE